MSKITFPRPTPPVRYRSPAMVVFLRVTLGAFTVTLPNTPPSSVTPEELTSSPMALESMTAISPRVAALFGRKLPLVLLIIPARRAERT